jgi:hypothetical protein
MDVRRQIALLMLLCSVTAGVLLWHTPADKAQAFESWEEFDQYLLQQIQNFGYPVERIRWRTVQVSDSFSRRVIIVDIPSQFPQTKFHKQLADSLRLYGQHTWGTVAFPERLSSIHVLQNETIVRSIQFQRANASP